MKKVFAIASTSLRRLFRDRSNYFFVFILPIGIIIIVGSMFGSGFAPTIGVVGPTDGLGLRAIESIEAVGGIDVVRYDDADDARLAVERSTVEAAAIIGDDVDDQLRSGGSVTVEWLARPDSAGPQLQAAVAAALDDLSSRVLAARLLDGELESDLVVVDGLAGAAPEIDVVGTTAGESIFGGELGQFDIGASTQLVLFMFLTGLTGSAALIQSRQLGVSQRMLGTPTSAGSIVLGEALGRFGVVLVQGLYIIAVTLVAFGVNWGDPLGAAAIMVVFGLAAAGAAMLMGSVFRNDQQAGGIGVMLGLGLAALGGSMIPVEVMPAGMQQVAKFTPHAWALDAFAELVRRDGTVFDILPQLGVLAGFAAGFLLLATWRFRAVLTKG